MKFEEFVGGLMLLCVLLKYALQKSSSSERLSFLILSKKYDGDEKTNARIRQKKQGKNQGASGIMEKRKTPSCACCKPQTQRKETRISNGKKIAWMCGLWGKRYSSYSTTRTKWAHKTQGGNWGWIKNVVKNFDSRIEYCCSDLFKLSYKEAL